MMSEVWRRKVSDPAQPESAGRNVGKSRQETGKTEKTNKKVKTRDL